MYNVLLFIHSNLRWVLLLALLYTIYRGYVGWFSKTSFTKSDTNSRLITVITAHMQLIAGLLLYFISPITRFFMSNFSDAVKIADFRFAALEHTLLMLIAIALITIGAVASKKKTTDQARFRTVAIWFSIALLIIILSIPWQLSPFGVEKPLLRGF
jgi:hypothetical protein